MAKKKSISNEEIKVTSMNEIIKEEITPEIKEEINETIENDNTSISEDETITSSDEETSSKKKTKKAKTEQTETSKKRTKKTKTEEPKIEESKVEDDQEEIKKTTRKFKKDVSVFIEFNGKQFSQAQIIEDIENIWVTDYGKKINTMKTLKVYVKPEDGRVYYVINEGLKDQINNSYPLY